MEVCINMKKETKGFNWKAVGGLAVTAMFIIALVLMQVSSDKKETAAMEREFQLKAQKEAELKQANAEALAAKEAATKLEAEKQAAEKKALELQEQLDNVEPVIIEVPVEKEAEETEALGPSHVEDDLSIGSVVPTITLSDVKLAKLFDTEVELDEDTYNVEESVVYSGLKIATGDEDYKGEALLEVPENGVFYKVSFDKDLTLADIGVDDENLEIMFLGQPMAIKSWSGSTIVVTRGEEVTLNEGDSLEVDGKTLTVEFISDNSEVSVSVDGETKVVSKGQSKTINGVDVFAKEVLTNRRAGIVTLKVGQEVLETVKDGDEVEGFHDWTWVVDGTNKEIGVVLTESFKGFDSEEEFNALKYGESFDLPYGHVKAVFTGLDVVDMTSLEMDLASKNGTDFVRVKGDFESGLEKFDKVYVSKVTNEIFGVDADSNDLTLLGTKVLVRGTDFELSATPTSVTVVDKGTLLVRAEFLKDFSDSSLDGSTLSGDENHLSNVGIRVSNREDASDDEVFKFSVPEEAVFATLTFQ